MHYLQVSKLMLNTFKGFEVDHGCFTPLTMVYTQHTIPDIQNNSFVVERPRTGLSLNYLRYLDLKLWSNVLETFKNLKKDQFKYRYKKFLLSQYTE